MRIHLDEGRAPVTRAEAHRQALRKRLAEAGLAGAGRPVQKDDAVPGDQLRVDTGVGEGEGGGGVVHQTLLDVILEDQRAPEAVEGARGERPLPARGRYLFTNAFESDDSAVILVLPLNHI